MEAHSISKIPLEDERLWDKIFYIPKKKEKLCGVTQLQTSIIYVFSNCLKYFSYLQNAGSSVPYFVANTCCHCKELPKCSPAYFTLWDSKQCFNPDISSSTLPHSLPTSSSFLRKRTYFLLPDLQIFHLSPFSLVKHIKPQFFTTLPSRLVLLHPWALLQWGPSTYLRSTFKMALPTADQSVNS